MNLSFKQIEAIKTYPIRHRVLWPHMPLEHCILSADENALHFGCYTDDNLISVASIFPDENKTVRLRKFAILPEYQRKGIGTKMIQTIVKHLTNDHIKTIWCDAREEASIFYEKLGFQSEGMRFFKNEIPYFKMKCELK